jgi:hypothetical protein
VITVSSLVEPDRVPRASAGRAILASVDVEWTKNYTIRNGNQPFCYSAVYVGLPDGDRADMSAASFEFTSVYLEPGEPAAALAARADAMLREILATSDIITGHQLCADLAVLASVAAGEPHSLRDARAAWHGRRGTSPARVIDTRYDVGHLLAGASRRLVDVATELALDVTQPELRGTSMTALHRTWLEKSDHAARERISVLNLRHSLSTGLIALLAAGRGGWAGTLNVNELIAGRAAGAWDWLDSATFRGLHARP